MLNTDYKSELQKRAQKNKQSINYITTTTTGPDHKKEFGVTLYINKTKTTEAKAFSIKEAEQKAAEKALKSVF